MAGTVTASVVKNDTTSPPQFQNSAGTEIGTLCRAWVNFNGTGTVAIRASFNVSSITDNGTGDYTVNFTNALSDANYSAVVSEVATGTWSATTPLITLTSSSVRFNTYNSGGLADASTACVAVFR